MDYLLVMDYLEPMFSWIICWAWIILNLCIVDYPWIIFKIVDYLKACIMDYLWIISKIVDYLKTFPNHVFLNSGIIWIICKRIISSGIICKRIISGIILKATWDYLDYLSPGLSPLDYPNRINTGLSKRDYRGFSLKWSNHLSGVTEVQISKVYHFEWMYHLSGCIIWVELLFFFRSVSFWASRQLDAKWLANLEQEYINHPSISHRCSRSTL